MHNAYRIECTISRCVGVSVNISLPCIFPIFCAGTGKSVTGAHLAYVFAKLNQRDQVEQKKLPANCCVLYCAPSNKAVDVVLGEYT